MRIKSGRFARGSAIASGMLVGLCAASAFAADGTLQVEQGLQWFDGGGGGTAFNGNVGGGEFGVYDWNLTNASLTLQPISATAMVNTIVNGHGPFTFQTFCLEPGVHIDFNTVLNFTVNTNVQLPGGALAPLNARTAYLFTKFYQAQAFVPAYVYSPLGVSRGTSAKDLQLAMWFTEGRSAYGGGATDNVDEYIADADAATGAGGGWTALWGSTFPGSLGGVRALNIDNNGALQQDLLAIFGEEPPPPPDGDCEGRTPGFWHNKNGCKLVKESGDGADWSWLTTINGLPLVDGTKDGHYLDNVSLDKDGFLEISDFLVSGNNAKNMAQKLSQHVAAMQFNLLSGLAGEDCLVYTGQNSDCVGGESTVEIGLVMQLAIESLEDFPYTPDGHAERDYQECLKNILDAANNNVNWVN